MVRILFAVWKDVVQGKMEIVSDKPQDIHVLTVPKSGNDVRWTLRIGRRLVENIGLGGIPRGDWTPENGQTIMVFDQDDPSQIAHLANSFVELRQRQLEQWGWRHRPG